MNPFQVFLFYSFHATKFASAMAQAGDALEEDIATFAIGPDGEQVSIAPGSTMAPASGHARVFTSIPDEANPAKMMLTFKDYPVTPGFTA